MGGVRTREEIEAALPALLDAVRAAYEGDDDDAWIASSDACRPLREGEVACVEAVVVALTHDPRWQARAAAVCVLRHLTGPGAPHAQPPLVPRALERACLLVGMIERETDARVRHAIVSAFVDLKHDVGEVLASVFARRFAADPDAGVRSAVAGVLSGIDLQEAIDALVVLSRDPDPEVRDWTCFGLGHQLGSPCMPGGIVDTPEIREALADRLDDPDGEASEEAATGLALRGDPRGVERMLAALARFDEEGVTTRVLMTSAEAPDARYVPALEAIVRERPDLREAVDALEACRAHRPRPTRSPRHFGCACMRSIFPEP